MSGPLGVVQVLQRPAHAVAAGQRGAAAALLLLLRLLSCRLVLEKPQRVRLHRLRNQTANTNTSRTLGPRPAPVGLRTSCGWRADPEPLWDPPLGRTSGPET